MPEGFWGPRGLPGWPGMSQPSIPPGDRGHSFWRLEAELAWLHKPGDDRCHVVGDKAQGPARDISGCESLPPSCIRHHRVWPLKRACVCFKFVVLFVLPFSLHMFSLTTCIRGPCFGSRRCSGLLCDRIGRLAPLQPGLIVSTVLAQPAGTDTQTKRLKQQTIFSRFWKQIWFLVRGTSGL